MAGVDLQGLAAAIFSRLATDSQGIAVRAVLGAGASSVIHATQLEEYSDDSPMPARPLVALRGGAVPGQSYEMRAPLWDWWIYDDRDQRYYRINRLVQLIEQAYPPYSIGSSTIGLGKIAVATIFDETADKALGLLTRRLQLAFYTRG